MKAFRFSFSDGYVFDESIGKLASYEFKSAWCIVGKDEDGWILDGEVTAIVGGVEKTLKSPVYVFRNEDEEKFFNGEYTAYAFVISFEVVAKLEECDLNEII